MPKPSISFFCPAYNDEENVGKVVKSAVEVLGKIAAKYEIIIVEDHSPDRTAEVADALAKKYNGVRVIHNTKNLGYGGALRKGFLNSKYDLIIYTDGDGQFNAADMAQMVPLLEKADVVSAYRLNRADPLFRIIQTTIFNALVRVVFGLKIRDINCALKLYRKKVVDSMKIESTSTFISSEMLLKAKKKGFRIRQIGVKHYPRLHGAASGAKPQVVLTTILDLIKQLKLLF